MNRVMLVFGTRPEAIKMCPVVKALKKIDTLETIVCVSGQHKQLLKQVLDAFEITPNYDLEIMQLQQTLFDITTNILNRIKTILEEVRPQLVLVHGDTSTAFATALACYYMKIPIGHVEAGLRTNNIYAPYPEEFNRQAISIISEYNFSPTKMAKENLISEGKDSKHIYVTGNTAIDALNITVTPNYKNEILDWVGERKIILITAHRRENIGEPMKNMFRAIKKIVNEFKDCVAIYPIHPNPKVREIANSIFKDEERIKLIEPLDVISFHNFMSKSYLILTDSGGIQEEAPSLGIPVLVMRDTTERPEGIIAGTLKLVGSEEKTIYEAVEQLFINKQLYMKMSKANNPYGDGHASERIANIIKNCLEDRE